jgi:DGQHR domain-containing protein
MDDALKRYGSKIEISNCILGGNLNLTVLRGFARLDLLAAISRPDVYDQVSNPYGTQRALEKKHALEAVEYATSAMSVAPETDPRAFSEIILNARDRALVAILDEDGTELEVSSVAEDSAFDPRAVSLAIDFEAIADEPEDAPIAISRVDGNHRLSQALASGEDELDAFPVVPFALFIGLSADQERALFRDINGTQKAMQTAHLDTIRIRLEGMSGRILQTETGRALWFAQHLSEPGHAFEGHVFMGGSPKGVKQDVGKIPPIRINTLKSAVLTTMREAGALEVAFNLSPVIDAEGNVSEVSEADAAQVLTLLDRYWTAVRNAFPQAWQNRKDYILLQAIGITAFSRLAADVIEERVFDSNGAIEQEDFDVILHAIASKVDLSRAAFPGVAGLAGAKLVYQRLVAAMTPDNVAVENARAKLAKSLGQGVSLLQQ